MSSRAEHVSPRKERFQTNSTRPMPIWKPTVLSSKIPMNIYREHVNKKFNLRLADSHELHHWSVTDPQAFWIDLWGYVGLIPGLPAGIKRAYDSDIPISEIPPFFEGATINYAENVLTQPRVDSQSPALIGLREGQSLDGDAEIWTWFLLRENVRRVRSALLRNGIKQGDRVAAIVSTSVWSVALFLASASIGAIFTSIAPDLGFEAGFRIEKYRSRHLLTVLRDAYLGYNKCKRPYCLPIATPLTRAGNILILRRSRSYWSCSSHVQRSSPYPLGPWRPVLPFQPFSTGQSILTDWSSLDSPSQHLSISSTRAGLQVPQSVSCTVTLQSSNTRKSVCFTIHWCRGRSSSSTAAHRGCCGTSWSDTWQWAPRWSCTMDLQPGLGLNICSRSSRGGK